MATLQSPGVQVTVIDESFYTPSAPGTVPLIVVASAQDKANASKTGTAQGTTQANAGKVWTITSQRDLADTFGVPTFYTDASQNPIHGGELNEYGLQAAYSLLGISSKAYVVRADINLTELAVKSSIPNGLPVSGTYWLDSGNTLFGINEWDAVNSVFTPITPIIIDDSNTSTQLTGLVPKSSVGAIGSYAVVATSDNENPIYYKNKNNQWVLLGSNDESQFNSNNNTSTWISHSWQSSWPVVTAATAPAGVNNANSVVINGQSVTLGTTSTVGIVSSINNQVNQFKVGAKISTAGKIELYSTAGTTTTGAILLSGTALSSLGLTAGSYDPVTLTIAKHTQVPQYATDGVPSGSAYIKTTSYARGASWVVKYYNGSTQTWGTVSAPLYANGAEAIKSLDLTGGKNIASGALYVESNYDHGTGARSTSTQLANFKIYRRNATSPTTVTGANDVTSVAVTTATSFWMSETVAGSSTVSVERQIIVSATSGTVAGATIVTAISAAGFTNTNATLNTDGTISISHTLGGEIYLRENNSLSPILPTLGFTGYNMALKTGTVNLYDKGDYDSYTYKATNWKPLVYEAKSSAPYTNPANGTLYYGSNLTEADIMYHNGTTWVGYKTAFPSSDPNGPQIKASAPTKQSDGTDLVDGDIWIDYSNSELYGKIVYVWNATTLKWVLQDTTDQETPNGWVFKDARWAASGQASSPATIKDLLTSDYLDPDAPDPAEYPQGTRLWNLRRSGYNVKKYIVNHIDVNANDGNNPRYINDPMDGSNATTAYFADRWVSVSPNAADGSGTFGRKAQRGFVVASMKSLIDTNQQIRDTDTLVFNLIATPGYPELVQNMIALNADRSYTGFVVGDTPFRLKATGTELANWGTNAALATDNGDEGGTSYDEYMAFFYPSGYTNDNSGNKIVVPPSHMMLRTIATSDQKSYVWFAPAGIRRGGVDNATSVGYLENGEFKTTALPTNIRNVMIETAKINPIATLNGVGIVNFGNLTRAKGASSLDRINVSRLVAYLRRQLDILSRPFLFEPNDKNTRNEIKSAAESLMIELVGQRAIYDFIVQCDETNNTPTRVDRSELWMDVAIEPVKAVEFIYIPLRLKNTGEIKAGL